MSTARAGLSGEAPHSAVLCRREKGVGMSYPGFRGQPVKSHRSVVRIPADRDTPDSDAAASEYRIHQ